MEKLEKGKVSKCAKRNKAVRSLCQRRRPSALPASPAHSSELTLARRVLDDKIASRDVEAVGVVAESLAVGALRIGGRVVDGDLVDDLRDWAVVSYCPRSKSTNTLRTRVFLFPIEKTE
jgi:hypothetical protein